MSVISRVKLDEAQRWTILNTLGAAAKLYATYAERYPDLADQFSRQAKDANALYELIESAETIALEDC